MKISYSFRAKQDLPDIYELKESLLAVLFSVT